MACSAGGYRGVGPGVSSRCFLICMVGINSSRIANTMPLLDRIQKDMVGRDEGQGEARLSAVRMIKTALKKHEVDSMKPLDEATEMQILNSLIKQRREVGRHVPQRRSRRAGGQRRSRAEADRILHAGARRRDEEIDAAIAAALAETGVTSAKQMGVVMKAAQAKLAASAWTGKR